MTVKDFQPRTRRQFLLQLAANLNAMDDAHDWAGGHQLWCLYGYRACLDALELARELPGDVPAPTVQPTPASAENWGNFEGTLRDELERCLELVADANTEQAERRRAAADVADLQHGLNLIEQRCCVVCPERNEEVYHVG